MKNLFDLQENVSAQLSRSLPLSAFPPSPFLSLFLPLTLSLSPSLTHSHTFSLSPSLSLSHPTAHTRTHFLSPHFFMLAAFFQIFIVWRLVPARRFLRLELRASNEQGFQTRFAPGSVFE